MLCRYVRWVCCHLECIKSSSHSNDDKTRLVSLLSAVRSQHVCRLQQCLNPAKTLTGAGFAKNGWMRNYVLFVCVCVIALNCIVCMSYYALLNIHLCCMATSVVLDLSLGDLSWICAVGYHRHWSCGFCNDVIEMMLSKWLISYANVSVELNFC